MASRQVNHRMPACGYELPGDEGRCKIYPKGGHERCALHRLPSKPMGRGTCTSCGKSTYKGSTMCLGPKCGFNAYLRERRRKIKLANAPAPTLEQLAFAELFNALERGELPDWVG